MSITYYVKKARSMTIKELNRRLYEKISSQFVVKSLYVHDRLLPSYKMFRESLYGLNPLSIDWDLIDKSGFDETVSKELWRMYKAHRFDLLGSGWVDSGYAHVPFGFEGHVYNKHIEYNNADELLAQVVTKQNLKQSKKVWHEIGQEYTPIDWQRDHKSGYTWSTKTWYKPAQVAEKVGGDIKMPWELSRLQHLVRLPILYEQLTEDREAIKEEYSNQLLDFIAQNPIRWGVNYMCTMDVGIRVANIAMSYSLFKASDVDFSNEFESILCNFIFQNCDFIYRNLEKSTIFNSNHYFSDLTGLLFGAALLHECGSRSKWLEFAIKEIDKEISKQFNKEGSNKEGSVAYHRLTTELALYSIAVIECLHSKENYPAISDESKIIVYKACDFINTLTRPDGLFSSVGDNDAGVLFRFSYTGKLIKPNVAKEKYHNLRDYVEESGDEYYYDENLCTPQALVSAGRGFYGKTRIKKYTFEYDLLKQFKDEKKQVLQCVEPEFIEKQYSELEYKKENVFELGKRIDLKKLNFKMYKQFGIAVYRDDDFYLSVAFTDNGQNGLAGHSHNDKLSLELISDGKIILEDPGTYVYTANVNERNKFRSVTAHNTADVGIEQNKYINTFRMEDDTRCNVIVAKPDELVAEVEYDEIKNIRRIKIQEDKVIVIDYCNKPFNVNFNNGLHTRGYGKILNEDYFTKEKSTECVEYADF